MEDNFDMKLLERQTNKQNTVIEKDDLGGEERRQEIKGERQENRWRLLLGR